MYVDEYRRFEIFVNYACRYALYVHVDRAEDVLIHKRLLEDAKVSENRAAFHVRAVHVRWVIRISPETFSWCNELVLLLLLLP